MDLNARDIHEKQFHDAWRGYNQEEVDDFLDRVAETVDRLIRENRALHQRIKELDQTVATGRETEDMLKKTLVTAQKAAEEAIASARAKAEHLIAEAEERVTRANEEARIRMGALEEELRRKTLDADRLHAAHKRDLDVQIERLRAYETELKHRLKTFLEQQLRALDVLVDARPAQAAPAMQGQPQPQQGAGQVAPNQGGAKPAAQAQQAASRPHATPSPRAAEATREVGNGATEQEQAPAGARRSLRGLLWGDE